MILNLILTIVERGRPNRITRARHPSPPPPARSARRSAAGERPGHAVFNGPGAPRFGVDESTKLFGTIGHAYVLIVRAQVDMAAGRFEDAVATAQMACQLDPSNREVANMHRRAKAAAAARLRGNDLFKAAKFTEACSACGEGLEREPGNAVLPCNRAACHAKLGRYEKAVEDCSAALLVRPAYSKIIRSAFKRRPRPYMTESHEH